MWHELKLAVGSIPTMPLKQHLTASLEQGVSQPSNLFAVEERHAGVPNGWAVSVGCTWASL